MTYVVSIFRKAEGDLNQIYDWLARHSPSGAARWYAAARNAIAGLREHPDRFALAPESSELTCPVATAFSKHAAVGHIGSSSRSMATRSASCEFAVLGKHP
jgi:plasmid stabilization system protein ParE